MAGDGAGIAGQRTNLVSVPHRLRLHLDRCATVAPVGFDRTVTTIAPGEVREFALRDKE